MTRIGGSNPGLAPTNASDKNCSTHQKGQNFSKKGQDWNWHPPFKKAGYCPEVNEDIRIRLAIIPAAKMNEKFPPRFFQKS